MDIYEAKQIKPMLIGESAEPFDSTEYIYELKLDGERCIAYLDPEEGTELRNKRNVKMIPKFPELADMHHQVSKRCILDGELIVTVDGQPEFFEVQRRSLMSNKFKIDLQSKQYPASYVAFDILYVDGENLTTRPLLERKHILDSTVKEGGRLAISRYIEEKGTDLYNLTVDKGLEGVVAKDKVSKYYFDKRTKDWIKIKNLQDDDFVVCGYILKDKGVTSIVLGQYGDDGLQYKGHVTLGVSGGSFRKIRELPRISSPAFDAPVGNENAVWVEPVLVCSVKYMEKMQSGALRQPVFKGLRDDKLPGECRE